MEPIQFRRTAPSEELAITATEVQTESGQTGRLALVEDDIAGTKMQLTVGELRWLVFTSGPDILRVLEADD